MTDISTERRAIVQHEPVEEEVDLGGGQQAPTEADLAELQNSEPVNAAFHGRRWHRLEPRAEKI